MDGKLFIDIFLKKRVNIQNEQKSDGVKIWDD